MTRETKIGLVVSASFLCLVGIVVASKWKRGDAPPNDHEEQSVKVAAAKLLQNGGDPKAGDGKKGETGPVAPAPAPDKKIAPPPGGDLPLVIIPPLQPLDTPRPIDIRPADGRPSFPPIGDPVPLLQGKKDENRPTFTFPPLEDKKPDIGIPPLTNKDGAPAFPPLGGNNPIRNDGPTFPPLGGTFPIKKEETPTFPPLGGTLPIKKEETPTFPPLGGTLPIKKEETPTFPPLGGTFPIKKEETPTFPPLGGTFPIKKEETPTFPPLGGTFPIKKEETPTFPPLGGKPAIIPANPAEMPAVPTISVGGFKPIINRYDPEFTELRFGEASFRDLSKRLYGSDRYSDALLAYNRDNYKLVKNGIVFGMSPPLLNPGQQIMYPPRELLERDYRTLIREIAPAAPGTSPIVRITPPIALDPGIAAVSNPPLGVPGTYTVQGQGGEFIRDIARRYLGNPDRWTEIYRLNPAVRPAFPIPTGTQLRLPTS